MKEIKHNSILVQELIAKYSTPPRAKGKFKGHGTTNIMKWLIELIKIVWKQRPKDKGKHDENMYITSHLGYILSTWYARVQRAKCFDPRRPVEVRKEAYKKYQNFVQTLMLGVASDEFDITIFPDQEWDNPFSPDAKNGTFI